MLPAFLPVQRWCLGIDASKTALKMLNAIRLWFLRQGCPPALASCGDPPLGHVAAVVAGQGDDDLTHPGTEGGQPYQESVEEAEAYGLAWPGPGR